MDLDAGTGNKFSQLPHSLKPRLMLWTDVSYSDMEEIDKMKTIPDLESTLCGVLHIDLPEPKRGVLLELYAKTVLFCRESSFNREQTSALLSIIKCIHQVTVETSLNMEQCFEYCGELLLCHSVRRPPFSINLFSFHEMNHILTYIHDTYIRQHYLYKYIFTPQVHLNLTLSYSGMPEEEEDPTLEDSAVPGVEETENESEAAQEEDLLPDTQETVTPGPEGATPGPKSELKAMIEQEVKEEMRLLSGRLEQQLKESADQFNSTLVSLQPNFFLASGVEETENESEAAQEEDLLPDTQETVTPGPEGATPGPKSELKAMIEQEVKEEMRLLSGRLEQQLKESADQFNSTLVSLQPKHTKLK